MLLTETVERYIVARGLRSDHSIRNQRKQAEALIRYLGRDPDLLELDDEFLARYWQERQKQVSQNSVSTEAGLLLSVLKWASRKRWCEWPDAIAPGRIRRAPQALTLDQVKSLLSAADRLTGKRRGVPANVQWRAYLLLALCTGERIGAIRQLRWRDFEGGAVTFTAETRKGGSSESVHVLPPAVIEAMNQLREKSKGAGEPFDWIDRSSIYAHWHALRQLADLPEWCRPHTLRKTAASHCATLEDAARLLRHASPATTLQTYRDPRIVTASAAQTELAKALEKPRSGWLRRLGFTG